MSNIKDVAEKADVSTATVSRVLNNPHTVKNETKKRVQKAIQEIDYQPNMLGRNLRRSSTRMVMILLENVSNPFYSRVIRGIEQIALENDYYIVICNNNSDPAQENTYLNLLRSKVLDGVIMMKPELSKKKLQELGSRFAVVQCCEYIDDLDIPFVSINNKKAAYSAVKHLLDQGHQNIGFISGGQNVPSAQQRKKGYKYALQESGITIKQKYIKNGTYGYKGGMEKTRELLSLKEKPTAIFAISDITAIGAIKTIREYNLKIPDEIAVVGFDNTSISRMYNPELTTIAQPRKEMGQKAMQLLIDIIQHNEIKNKNIFLDHKLIIRESSKN